MNRPQPRTSSHLAFSSPSTTSTAPIIPKIPSPSPANNRMLISKWIPPFVIPMHTPAARAIVSTSSTPVPTPHLRHLPHLPPSRRAHDPIPNHLVAIMCHLLIPNLLYNFFHISRIPGP